MPPPRPNWSILIRQAKNSCCVQGENKITQAEGGQRADGPGMRKFKKNNLLAHIFGNVSAAPRSCFFYLPLEEVNVERLKRKDVITLTTVSPSDANPIIRESLAKQLLRSKRQDRPRKAGHPDEPMRVSVSQSRGGRHRI